MNIQTANNKMEVLMNQRLRLQRAYSAANSMMFQLQIPEGNHLAFVLNQAEARSNRDAICGWLIAQNFGQLIDERGYKSLQSKLRCVLEDCSIDSSR